MKHDTLLTQEFSQELSHADKPYIAQKEVLWNGVRQEKESQTYGPHLPVVL
jgi:hypothetical protein